MTTQNPASSNGLFADALKQKAASDTPVSAPEVSDAPKPDELAHFKRKADLIGLKYSNNIGLEALKTKIREKLEGDAKAAEANQEPEASLAPAVTDPVAPEVSQAVPAALVPETKPAPKKTELQLMKEREMKLIRVRITNMDPKKADLPGEIITFANRVLGTVRKFVPFGDGAGEHGYHVPYCIYKILRDREFLHIKVNRGKFGLPKVSARYVKEFALEILPTLTPRELADLKAAQAAKGGVSDDVENLL